MPKIELYLTRGQHNKCKNGCGFRLTHENLINNPKAKHRGIVKVSDKTIHKLVHSLNSGCGFTFRKNEYLGDGLWDDIKGGFNKVADAGRQGISFVKEHAGDVVETLKENIPEGFVQSGVDGAVLAGCTAIGQPELAALAIPLAHKAVSATYKHNFRKPFNQSEAIEDVKESIKEAAKDKYDEYAPKMKKYAKQKAIEKLQEYVKPKGDGYTGFTGHGLSNKRHKKGSDEAKAHMAKIRSMRKHGNGFNPFDGNSWKDLGNQINNTVVQPVKTVVAPYIRPIIKTGLTTGINAITDSPAGTFLSPLTGMAVDKGLDAAKIGIGFKKSFQGSVRSIKPLRRNIKSGGSFLPIGGKSGGSFLPL